MRGKRVLAVVLAALSCAFFATACGGDKKPEEEHEYVYYKASDPTCTEKGKVERVCIKCGAKDYLEIEALGHIYKNGVCTRCGAEENYAPDEWRVRFILGGNEALTRATVYYYSETVPAVAGNYWHYVSGVPTVW